MFCTLIYIYFDISCRRVNVYKTRKIWTEKRDNTIVSRVDTGTRTSHGEGMNATFGKVG